VPPAGRSLRPSEPTPAAHFPRPRPADFEHTTTLPISDKTDGGCVVVHPSCEELANLRSHCWQVAVSWVLRWRLQSAPRAAQCRSALCAVLCSAPQLRLRLVALSCREIQRITSNLKRDLSKSVESFGPPVPSMVTKDSSPTFSGSSLTLRNSLKRSAPRTRAERTERARLVLLQGPGGGLGAAFAVSDPITRERQRD